MINHRVMRWVVAFGFGLIVSLYAFQRASDPGPGIERAREEAVVHAARRILGGYVEAGREIEVVDPLAPDLNVGRVYVFPADGGWEVSGFYRRGEHDGWHAFLMQLDSSASLAHLAIRDDDSELARIAASDPKLTVTPSRRARP